MSFVTILVIVVLTGCVGKPTVEKELSDRERYRLTRAIQEGVDYGFKIGRCQELDQALNEFPVLPIAGLEPEQSERFDRRLRAALAAGCKAGVKYRNSRDRADLRVEVYWTE